MYLWIRESQLLSLYHSTLALGKNGMYVSVLCMCMCVFWWKDCCHFQRIYLNIARQLRRLETRQRSPVFAGFSETLSGLSCIRAYQQQQRFIVNADHRLNNSVASFYALQCSMRYMQTCDHYLDFYFDAVSLSMMTSSNGNIFRITGHLCGEFTGPRWIPRTKASDAELWCFLWSASE